MLHLFIVFFDKHNQIAEMHTLRNLGDGPRQPWITKLRRYQNRNGVLIPTELEAGWKIQDVYRPYARFTIQQIAYNIKTL